LLEGGPNDSIDKNKLETIKGGKGEKPDPLPANNQATRKKRKTRMDLFFFISGIDGGERRTGLLYLLELRQRTGLNCRHETRPGGRAGKMGEGLSPEKPLGSRRA